MLNLFRCVAVAIMLLASAQVLLKSFTFASQRAAAAKLQMEQEAERAKSPEEPGPSEKQEKPIVSQFVEASSSVIHLLEVPLLQFCAGAILLVLVRIARDQAHDLAAGP